MRFEFVGGGLELAVPRVMGILNVTPDSFSDGGQYTEPSVAAARACELAAAGADILDIGAQSTRPGAQRLSAEGEWTRLAPCLAAVRAAVDIPVSVDTFEPLVACRAMAAGAQIINDVSGSEQNGMAAVAAECGAGLILTRSGNPKDRTAAAEEVVADAVAYFTRALDMAAAVGLPRKRVCLDVGIGFGSSAAGDLALIAQLPSILRQFPDVPVLVGASRKRVIADVCGALPPAERLAGTLALHTVALWNGAHIVRAHDVKEAAEAAALVAALKKERNI